MMQKIARTTRRKQQEQLYDFGSLLLAMRDKLTWHSFSSVTLFQKTDLFFGLVSLLSSIF
jgi:hypothetical protein